MREIVRSGLLVPDVIATTVVGGRHGLVLRRVAAAAGPTTADFARSILLRADTTDKATMLFITHVRGYGRQRRGIAADELGMRVVIVAAARLAEGFGGSYASRLGAIARHGI
jgi:hypothetical protein